jgi:hypothetical protein
MKTSTVKNFFISLFVISVLLILLRYSSKLPNGQKPYCAITDIPTIIERRRQREENNIHMKENKKPLKGILKTPEDYTFRPKVKKRVTIKKYIH